VEVNLNRGTKLMRTFASLTDAVSRYRGKGAKNDCRTRDGVTGVPCGAAINRTPLRRSRFGATMICGWKRCVCLMFGQATCSSGRFVESGKSSSFQRKNIRLGCPRETYSFYS
jgi:hypothetical protein